MQKSGKYVQCECLIRERLAERLGSFSSHTRIPKVSKLEEFKGQNILLFGDREKVRSHVAKVLRDDDSLKCYTVPAQMLLNFQFEDKGHGQGKLLTLRKPPWILIELGISDVPNCYLPELIVSLCSDRKVQKKTTWVYSAKPLKVLYERYRGSSGDNLRDFFTEYMDKVIDFD